MKKRACSMLIALLLCLSLGGRATLQTPQPTLPPEPPALGAFDPALLEAVYLPEDPELPIDLGTAGGIDALLNIPRHMFEIVLPEGAEYRIAPSEVLLLRSGHLLQMDGTFRLSAPEKGGQLVSFILGIVYEGGEYRPYRLIFEDLLVWESVRTVEAAPVLESEAWTVFPGLLYPMKRGDQVDDARRLQQALKELGFYRRPEIVITFGEATQRAVRDFQRANGLEATGTADEETLRLLYGGGTMLNMQGDEVELSEECMYIEYRTLKFGDQGEVVRRLQKALLDLELYDDALSTRFGANTELAVSRFQEANGLPATGRADHATQSLLYTGVLPEGALPTPTPEAGPEDTPAPGEESGETEGGTLPPRTPRPEGTPVLDEIPDLTPIPIPQG